MRSAVIAASTILIASLAASVGASHRLLGEPGRDQILERHVGLAGSSFGSARQAFISVLLAAGLPGGVAREENCRPEPERRIVISGSTLGESLRSIVRAAPSYRWADRDGVLDLTPAAGLPAFLRVRVRRFDSKGATNLTWAASLLLALPEVRRAETRLGIGKSPNPIQLGLMALPRKQGAHERQRPLGVHTENTTVLGVLNSIVRADNRGIWTYIERKCHGQNTFRMSFAH